MEKPNKDDVMVEGLRLNADMLMNLSSMKFVIIGAKYESMTDYRDKTKVIRKLILTVEIDGFRLTYIPNQKSINRLVIKHGINASKWIGETAELEKKTLVIAGTEQEVLFVRE